MQKQGKLLEALAHAELFNEDMYKILQQLIAFTSDRVAAAAGIVDGPLKEDMDDCFERELVDAYWTALETSLKTLRLDDLQVKIEE